MIAALRELGYETIYCSGNRIRRAEFSKRFGAIPIYNGKKKMYLKEKNNFFSSIIDKRSMIIFFFFLHLCLNLLLVNWIIKNTHTQKKKNWENHIYKFSMCTSWCCMWNELNSENIYISTKWNLFLFFVLSRWNSYWRSK